MLDIEDVEAFVIMCIKRSGVRPEPYEYEDLVATGIAILWEMRTKYKPSPTTTKSSGRGWCFSGYAIRYLPKKIKEAYHRGHEHHLQRTQPDGTRRWEYSLAPVDISVGYDERRVRNIGNFIPVPQSGE